MALFQPTKSHFKLPSQIPNSIQKNTSFSKITPTHFPIPLKIHPFITHLKVSPQTPTLIPKTSPLINLTPTHFPIPLQNKAVSVKIPPFLMNTIKPHIPLSILAVWFCASPCFAAEPDKIDLEAVVVAIDDFNNRNPFFVAGLTFIWLVVIPLTQEYLKKFKFVSAIDAFRKLRDMPNAQLLDIRKQQSLKYMSSPNLKILKKNAVQVEFSEGEEEEFVKEILKNFPDPANTVVCVLDNFDGDSLVVAKLLFKNGFKEAYAIKGGLRGKNGWQAIQEELLPPSTHVYPRKKKGKRTAEVKDHDTESTSNTTPNGQPVASANVQQERI